MTDARTIAQVAARSGVAASALRFYEEQGLIRAERTSAGHRRYSRGVIRRVAFIVFAQKVGLTLDEIRTELAKLPRSRARRLNSSACARDLLSALGAAACRWIAAALRTQAIALPDAAPVHVIG